MKSSQMVGKLPPDKIYKPFGTRPLSQHPKMNDVMTKSQRAAAKRRVSRKIVRRTK